MQPHQRPSTGDWNQIVKALRTKGKRWLRDACADDMGSRQAIRAEKFDRGTVAIVRLKFSKLTTGFGVRRNPVLELIFQSCGSRPYIDVHKTVWHDIPHGAND